MLAELIFPTSVRRQRRLQGGGNKRPNAVAKLCAFTPLGPATVANKISSDVASRNSVCSICTVSQADYLHADGFGKTTLFSLMAYIQRRKNRSSSCLTPSLFWPVNLYMPLYDEFMNPLRYWDYCLYRVTLYQLALTILWCFRMI